MLQSKSSAQPEVVKLQFNVETVPELECQETMAFTPSPVVKRSLLLATKFDSKEGKSYFWSDAEHFKFVATFHVQGRQWKKISLQQVGRDPLQCRTHGQKYLMSLQQLNDEIKKTLAGTSIQN